MTTIPVKEFAKYIYYGKMNCGADIVLIKKKCMSSWSFKLNAPWDIVKERMKENNIELTDEDLQYTPGKEDELLQRLQKKIGKPKEEIKRLIESISSNTERAS